MNTVKVFYHLDGIIYDLNKELDEKKANQYKIQELAGVFYTVLDILGFKFELRDYDLKTRYLLYQWQNLRQQANFSPADQIRKQLQAKDIL